MTSEDTITMILKGKTRYYTAEARPLYEREGWMVDIDTFKDADKVSLTDLTFIKSDFRPYYSLYSILMDNTVTLHFEFDNLNIDEVEDEMQKLVDRHLEDNDDN